MRSPRPLHLTLFLPTFGEGGMERMLVNMAGGLAALGLQVDFWVGRTDAPFLDRLPPTVRTLRHEAASSRRRRLALGAYLSAERPDVVLAAKDPAVLMALAARRQSGVGGAVVARPGTVSERLRRRPALLRWRDRWAMRRAYRGADLIVANSHGLARDAAKVAGVAIESIPVVRNPVITPDLEHLAAAPVAHPWLGPERPPVLLGAGGFRRQKDFHTLLRAFARVRAERDVRLILLGRGRLEASLRRLAAELGVARDVDFPGFAENPYPFMKAAAVFVLSSRWEGSPNVLTEALALGTPAVATDCPSGPAETLQEGRVGLLVPVGDADAMAGAVLRTLDQPPDPARLRAAVREYTVAENARRYAELLQALVAGRSRAGSSGAARGER
jgi:glycosyltransferase involved in cell wall biosynthesis